MKLTTIMLTLCTVVALSSCANKSEQSSTSHIQVAAPLNAKESKAKDKLDQFASFMRSEGTQRAFNMLNGMGDSAHRHADLLLQSTTNYLSSGDNGEISCIENSHAVAFAGSPMSVNKGGMAPEPYGNIIIQALQHSPDGVAVVKHGYHTIIAYNARNLTGKGVSDVGKKFYCAIAVKN